MLLTIRSNLTDEQVQKALDRAVKIHEGQVALCHRTPFILHPLSVLNLISDWGITDTATRQAAVLHESLNPLCHQPLTFEQIGEDFGKKVAKIVQEGTFIYDDPMLESEDSEMKKAAKKRRQKALAEYFKTFKDKRIETLVIKVADRLLVTEDLLSTKPNQSGICFKEAKELFLVMKLRQPEIEAIKKTGEVWSRMRHKYGMVQQAVY
jgi:(p)ppGpp synthase/HD superfamily hydrolase